jgi:hypothetical protein
MRNKGSLAMGLTTVIFLSVLIYLFIFKLAAEDIAMRVFIVIVSVSASLFFSFRLVNGSKATRRD